jgi:ACS family tartrate transporter-like MFS transporter
MSLLALSPQALDFLERLFLNNPRLAIAAQAIVWIGINMQNGPFWSLPGSLLSGTAAAGGIALVSTVAFMGGFPRSQRFRTDQ